MSRTTHVVLISLFSLAFLGLCLLCVQHHGSGLTASGHAASRQTSSGHTADVLAVRPLPLPNPASVPSPPTLKRRLAEELGQTTIEFETASGALTPEAQALLDELAPLIREGTDAGATVEIAGHADSTGPASFNLDLSRRRAEAVRRYLIERGTPEKRLDAGGYGENQPVADNATAESRRKNRRIAFRVRLQGDR